MSYLCDYVNVTYSLLYLFNMQFCFRKANKLYIYITWNCVTCVNVHKNEDPLDARWHNRNLNWLSYYFYMHVLSFTEKCFKCKCGRECNVAQVVMHRRIQYCC